MCPQRLSRGTSPLLGFGALQDPVPKIYPAFAEYPLLSLAGMLSVLSYRTGRVLSDRPPLTCFYLTTGYQVPVKLLPALRPTVPHFALVATSGGLPPERSASGSRRRCLLCAFVPSSSTAFPVSPVSTAWRSRFPEQ